MPPCPPPPPLFRGPCSTEQLRLRNEENVRFAAKQLPKIRRPSLPLSNFLNILIIYLFDEWKLSMSTKFSSLESQQTILAIEVLNM